MPFDWDDPYTMISCKILKVSAKAVQIEDENGIDLWVPRSCVHGGDDRILDDSVGDDLQIKIRRWFADKEGLI